MRLIRPIYTTGWSQPQAVPTSETKTPLSGPVDSCVYAPGWGRVLPPLQIKPLIIVIIKIQVPSLSHTRIQISGLDLVKVN